MIPDIAALYALQSKNRVRKPAVVPAIRNLSRTAPKRLTRGIEEERELTKTVPIDNLARSGSFNNNNSHRVITNCSLKATSIIGKASQKQEILSSTQEEQKGKKTERKGAKTTKLPKVTGFKTNHHRSYTANSHPIDRFGYNNTRKKSSNPSVHLKTTGILSSKSLSNKPEEVKYKVQHSHRQTEAISPTKTTEFRSCSNSNYPDDTHRQVSFGGNESRTQHCPPRVPPVIVKERRAQFRQQVTTKVSSPARTSLVCPNNNLVQNPNLFATSNKSVTSEVSKRTNHAKNASGRSPLTKSFRPSANHQKNYYEALFDTENMPRLAKSQIIAPPRDFIRTPVAPSAIEPTETEGWTPVPNRRSSTMINPYVSGLSPHKIPRGNGILREHDVETAFNVPTMVKIRPTKKGVKFNIVRIVHALLLAMQEAEADISFGPVNRNDSELPRINNINQIPTVDEELEKYIENPRKTKYGIFMARIMIHTNQEIHQLKLHRQFRNWLIDENISIEYNPLLTETPVNIGFVLNVCPREDTVLIHQKRLELALDLPDLEFHASKQQLYAGYKHRCFIIMIRGGAEDYDAINNKLIGLHAEEQLEYFPWNEYMGLNRLQRMTLINEQNQFMAKYRSLVITGFADDDDDIPMVFIEENSKAQATTNLLPADDTGRTSVEETKDDLMLDDDDDVTADLPNPMEFIGVSEYLRNHIYTGKGANMFSYVYPPILGTREVIVLHEHASEATSFIRSCHGTLAKLMNEAAIRCVFKNPEEATAMTLKPAWKPFQKTRDVPEAITTRQDDTRNTFKRGSETTYLTAATKQKMNVWTPVIPSTASTASRTTGLTSHKTDEWEIILKGITDRLALVESENQSLRANEEQSQASNKRRNPDVTSDEVEQQVQASMHNAFRLKLDGLQQIIDERLERAVNHLKETDVDQNAKLAHLEKKLETKMVAELKKVDSKLTTQIQTLDVRTRAHHAKNDKVLDRLMKFCDDDKKDKRLRRKEMAHIKNQLHVLSISTGASASEAEPSDADVRDVEEEIEDEDDDEHFTDADDHNDDYMVVTNNESHEDSTVGTSDNGTNMAVDAE